MNFNEAMEWMEDLNELGSVLGLENMERLMERLAFPDEKLNIIHVAGTNGKGSVSSFIAEVAMEHGARVGRYISPTIFSYQERFQLNHRQMGKEKLAAYFTEMRTICEKIVAEGFPHPTSFEIETAVALLYFQRENCDLVVLEVGMGGRLDATNVIKHPMICVLCSISMDHMQFLGDDISKIAAEKCGIMKEGTVVVSACQDLEAEKVIIDCCKEKNLPLTFVDEEAISSVKHTRKKQSFCYRGEQYSISLLGSYQVENACLALEVLRTYETIALKKALINKALSISKIRQALENTKWPGRFQIIHEDPCFVVDGAHNVDGAKRLMESIDLYFTNKAIIYIMGMFRDKEYEKVISITCPRALQIITIATPENKRALPALDLAEAVQKVNPNVTTASSVEEAVEMAYLFAGKEAVIVSFGSLSFLGKMIDFVTKNQTVRSDTHGK